ncbi:Protein CBG22230 [Caenorhabditis briggsae]|uniref:Protein CBG22230 n=1 Tax=Caenorhabditis briggsae TaxID=6238 RepID=A8Y1U4_CAEBR|nr:Protein CBG22230 [Caenorhabditis briggsae]CAP38864.2 Protein CBG22230 [Caenorhabditis briggsae]
MARFSILSLLFVVFSLVLAVYFLIQISPDPQISSNLKRKILENWSICARKQLDKTHTADEVRKHRILRRIFWHQFSSLTTYCDVAENIDLLGLISLKNSDEVKYALMPKNLPTKNSTFNFVTLGIGKDITAEKSFKEEAEFLGYQGKFYGADPIIEDNSQLFSQIGEYFPFAIGGKTEISNASVLKNGTYREETISHVELLKFLKDDLKIAEIDHLWLDAEGAEFGLFDYFYNDGPLERNVFQNFSNFRLANLSILLVLIFQKTFNFQIFEKWPISEFPKYFSFSAFKFPETIFQNFLISKNKKFPFSESQKFSLQSRFNLFQKRQKSSSSGLYVPFFLCNFSHSSINTVLYNLFIFSELQKECAYPNIHMWFRKRYLTTWNIPIYFCFPLSPKNMIKLIKLSQIKRFKSINYIRYYCCLNNQLIVDISSKHYGHENLVKIVEREEINNDYFPLNVSGKMIDFQLSEKFEFPVAAYHLYEKESVIQSMHNYFVHLFGDAMEYCWKTDDRKTPIPKLQNLSACIRVYISPNYGDMKTIENFLSSIPVLKSVDIFAQLTTESFSSESAIYQKLEYLEIELYLVDFPKNQILNGIEAEYIAPTMKPPTHTLPKLYIGNDNKTNTDPIISHTYVVRESVSHVASVLIREKKLFFGVWNMTEKEFLNMVE